MLEVMLITGVATVIGVVLILAKAGIDQCLRYDLAIDIAITALIMWTFNGSTTGIVTGAFTGGLLSIVLFIIKGMRGLNT
jgi:hypothetical protein